MSAYVPSEAEVEAAVLAICATHPVDSNSVGHPSYAEHETMARAALVAAHTVAPTPREDVAERANRLIRDYATGFGHNDIHHRWHLAHSDVDSEDRYAPCDECVRRQDEYDRAHKALFDALTGPTWGDEADDEPVASLSPGVLRARADEVSMHAGITGDPITRENAELLRALADAKDRATPTPPADMVPAAALAEERRRANLACSVLADLDRCQHGRHEGDVCNGCGGPSKGNPRMGVNRTLGYDLSGRPYRVPAFGSTQTPEAWDTLTAARTAPTTEGASE